LPLWAVFSELINFSCAGRKSFMLPNISLMAFL
jgi:hypothetical protein